MNACAVAVREVLVEAIEKYDKLADESRGVLVTEVDRDLERDVRQHFLDRWYRFAPFGVTTRSELAKLRVVVAWHHNANLGCRSRGADAGACVPGCHPRRDTTVVVLGTPLEQYAV